MKKKGTFYYNTGYIELLEKWHKQIIKYVKEFKMKQAAKILRIDAQSCYPRT